MAAVFKGFDPMVAGHFGLDINGAFIVFFDGLHEKPPSSSDRRAVITARVIPFYVDGAA
jgi:hypothetical protein